MINSKELLKYTQDLTLLFVEDHEELRLNTTEILKNFFKVVECAADGEEALHLYKEKIQKQQQYDIVISDIRMPRMDGVALTKNIYDIHPTQSVIILSAHDESEYLLPLINLGIEQFIKKPIDYQELLDALFAIVKKTDKNSTLIVDTTLINLAFDFTFNKETKILLHNTQNISLTKYEIIFLECITDEVGKIYSSDDIVSYFTNLKEDIDPQNIRKLVSKLRKKLPKECLESIYGVGYRIIPSYK